MAQKKPLSEVIFVRAGISRKKRVLKAIQILEQSESDFVKSAVDEKLDRLEKRYPKLKRA